MDEKDSESAFFNESSWGLTEELVIAQRLFIQHFMASNIEKLKLGLIKT